VSCNPANKKTIGLDIKPVLTSYLTLPEIKRKSKNARLIDNDRIKNNVILRAGVLRHIRKFFEKRDFIEVDTPLMGVYPSMEPAISSFTTDYFDGRENHRMYLQPSPEYNMKKLLASGYDNIFQITKSFRNSELTHLHNPEFTILEWYRTWCDYNQIMDDVEELIAFISSGINSRHKINYLNKKIDLSAPYDRLYVNDAFKVYSEIDLDDLTNDDYYKILCDKGLKIKKEDVDFNTFFYFIFVNEIEPNLGNSKPVFLIDFPKELSSLARRKKTNSRYVERFELYIAGLEISNAFSELNDYKEQEERLLKEKKKRSDNYPVDKELLNFLKYGMPPAAGIAMGIDRLLMLFADTEDISDVILFPFSMMKEFKENV
jgi:EF-P lysine aminoacylase GenX